MALDLKLQTKLSQQLVLTPQLQLSIKVLQLNHLELRESIELEVQENPVLELAEQDNESDFNNFSEDTDVSKILETYSRIRDNYNAKIKSYNQKSPDDEEANIWENFVTKPTTLYNHLLWQLHLGHFTPAEVRIGEEIIGNIDPDGYLRVETYDIARELNVSKGDVDSVLKRIQQFDPIGVGSRNLTECLLVQLEVFESNKKELLKHLVTHYLEDLSKKNFKKIAQALSVTVDDIVDAFELIKTLNPKPGKGFAFSEFDNQYIEPDVFVIKDGDEYKVFLNREGIPSLKINRQYEQLLKNKQIDESTKNFLQEKIKNAYWFIKSIQQRGSTILRVAKAIVDYQRDFFEKGINYMKPLTLKDLSLTLDLHESTISRVTSNKYMLTPVGLFEMKYFFSTGIRKIGSEDVASVSVKQLIKELIEGEDPKSPLSDQEISDILKAKGYNIARRTVTKYRESLGILSSSMRKTYKS
jgi:RNA polymerase sigma-54 factor